MPRKRRPNVWNATAAAAVVFGLTLCAPVWAQSTEPFSMRGVALGITLDEFRELEPAPIEDGAPSASIECYEVTSIVAGYWVCKWTVLGPSNGLRPGANPPEVDASVRISDGAGVPEFTFSPVLDGQSRLISITVRSPMWMLNDILAGFVGQYGKPKTTKRQLQNAYGAQYAAQTHTWSNDASSITMETMCGGNREALCIIYTHKAGLADHEKRQKDARGAPRF